MYTELRRKPSIDANDSLAGEMKWYDETHYNIYSFEKMVKDSPEFFCKELVFYERSMRQIFCKFGSPYFEFQKNFRDTKMKWSVRWTK